MKIIVILVAMSAQLSLAKNCLLESRVGDSVYIRVNKSLSFTQKLKCRRLYCPSSEKRLNCIDPDENNPESGPQDGSEMSCCTMIEV